MVHLVNQALMWRISYGTYFEMLLETSLVMIKNPL